MENNDSVYLEKVFDTEVDNVWQAWTDPVIVLKWFGSDPDGKGLEAKLEVYKGGSFEVTFEDSDQTQHTCSGAYLEVEELQRLVFSWTWKSEPGVESLVKILFFKEEGSTRMQFEHSGVGNQSKHGYLKGWQSTFQKLERVLNLGK